MLVKWRGFGGHLNIVVSYGSCGLNGGSTSGASSSAMWPSPAFNSSVSLSNPFSVSLSVTLSVSNCSSELSVNLAS